MTVRATRVACRLPAHPAVAVADANGKELIHSDLPLANDGPVLDAGSTKGFSFELGNWCDTTARLPLQVVGLLADGPIKVAGLDMTEDGLPPCNGPGQPAHIAATDWQ